MAGKIPRARAIEEAGHAVIARKFGIEVVRVSSRKDAHALIHSAAYLARGADTSSRVRAFEQDVIVALAGRVALRHEHPNLSLPELFDDDDGDALNARSAIYKIVCFTEGRPVPEGNTFVGVDPGPMQEVYSRLLRETTALVNQHWPAIARVAKHLERHSGLDQAKLDELI
jgi:hypothetical protein